MYKELYSLYPRQIGIPFRITCENKSEFYSNINRYMKQYRVYASIYNYISNDSYIKNNLAVDKIYFDFDGLEDHVRNEVKTFAEKLYSENIKHTVIYSGGGFHMYIWTKNYATLDSKKASLLNSHNHFINEYDLKYLDPAVVGDIARLATIPNTYNYKRKSFATPISIDDIMTISPTQQQVVNTSKFIAGNELFDISEYNSKEIIYCNTSEENIPELTCKLNIDYYDKLPQCLQNILQEGYGGKYVGTYKRMLLILFMRDVGIPIGNIVELFKYYLRGQRKGIVEWRHCLHEHQIEFVYMKSYQYGFPDCERLKDKGLCPMIKYCDYVKEYYNGKHVLKCYK